MKKKKFISVALVICMLMTMSPVCTFADSPTSVSSTSVSEDKSAHTVTITLDSYLQDPTEYANLTINGCDIIFLLDQSVSMNADRDTVIDGIRNMIASLPTPTDGNASHRIALAGYGRINNASNGNPDSTVKGNKDITGASSGTGYYTYTNSTVGFKSGRWTDGTADTVTNGVITQTGNPPTIDASDYALSAATGYSNAFMSVGDAENVLDTSKMCTWYTGAARLDAGLVLAQTLESLANSADTNKNRDTIVVVVAASAAIQESGGNYTSRRGAAQTTSTAIKGGGATIFALGDYKQLIQNQENVDSLAIFDDIFSKVTGTSGSASTDADKYFVSKSSVLTIEAAIKQLLTKVKNNVIGMDSSSTAITTSAETASSMYVDLGSITSKYKLNLTGATASTYPFTGYESDAPAFDSTAFDTLTNQTVSLKSNQLSYSTTLMPIPTASVAEKGYKFGDKVVVKVTGVEAYDVTLNGSLTSSDASNIGSQMATYGSAYTSTITSQPDTVIIRVKNASGIYEPLSAQNYSYTGGVLTINSAAVTGDIDIATQDFPDKTVNAAASSASGGTVQVGSGTAGATASGTVAYLTSAGLTATAAANYSFDGWYSDSTYNTLVTDQNALNVSYNDLTDGATYYAKFTKMTSDITYKGAGTDTDNNNVPDNAVQTVSSGSKITIVPNGGTWRTSAEDQTLTVSTDIDLLADPTYAGHVFTGWTKTAGTGDITWIFTAQWEEDSIGGGTDGTTSDGIPDKYQKKVTFSIENGTWSTTAGDNADKIVYVTLTDANGKWSETGSGTLTAPDVTNATAAQNYGGGAWDAAVPATVSGTADATYTYTFTIGSSDITFKGAGTDANHDNVPDNAVQTVSNGSKITIVPNGGTWRTSTEDQTLTVSTDIDLLADPIYVGHVFTGWTKTAGTGDIAWIFTAQWREISGGGTTGTIPDSSNITYKGAGTDANNDNVPDNAVQTVSNGSKITIVPNGGIWRTSAENQTLTVSTDIDLLADPTYTGHVFMGWTKTAGTGDIAWVFTAKWEEDSFGGGTYGTTPDGIPDKYQKKVTFRVENGTWSTTAGDNADKVVYVTLTDANGKWSETGSGTLTAPDVTNATAAKHYAGGAWDAPVPVTVSGTADATYTYAFTRGSSDGTYKGGGTDADKGNVSKDVVPATGDFGWPAPALAFLLSFMGLAAVLFRRKKGLMQSDSTQEQSK